MSTIRFAGTLAYSDAVETFDVTANVVACDKCRGEGWLEPIGPHSDGSYITSRRCLSAAGMGFSTSSTRRARP